MAKKATVKKAPAPADGHASGGTKPRPPVTLHFLQRSNIGGVARAIGEPVGSDIPNPTMYVVTTSDQGDFEDFFVREAAEKFAASIGATKGSIKTMSRWDVLKARGVIG